MRVTKSPSLPPWTQTGIGAGVAGTTKEKSLEGLTEEEPSTPELSLEGDGGKLGACPASQKIKAPPKGSQCKKAAMAEKYRVMRTEAQHLAFLSNFGEDVDSVREQAAGIQFQGSGPQVAPPPMRRTRTLNPPHPDRGATFFPTASDPPKGCDFSPWAKVCRIG